jgi:hypothetical protein
MRRPKAVTYSIFALAWFSIPAHGQKLDIEQIEQSIRYINNLQSTDGGFRASESDAQSTISATTAALRAHKYLHPRARPRDQDGPREFVLKCYNKSVGAFASRPGGECDVHSTAMGLMALVELKTATDQVAGPCKEYFAQRAKSLSEIYIAVAALHAAGLSASTANDWIALFAATRTDGGVYGKSPVDTAGAVITILRLGGKIEDPDAVAAVLNRAQRDDGGFAGTDASDLGTTYRIMRALYMLKTRPNIQSCRAFLARCRNVDGGYGLTPGQRSTVSATYFAVIVMHWLDELERG